MADEKVSVIIPVYNVEKYLARCLDSVINQTYLNLEIILVDDGSPDNCGAICDEYALRDDRVRVIHQENGGVSSARNTALQTASGEYIVFVDSDDSILPDYVKNLMSAGQSDYVVSGCYVQSEQNEWSEWKNVPQETTLARIKQNPRIINTIPTGMVWAKRYKRDIIKENTLSFRCDISRGEDTLFNCIYLNFCETITVIDALDYQYYHNEASATSKLNTNLFRWSMESVFAIGEIIGRDNQLFYERVWGNAQVICDNYLHAAHGNSFRLKLQLLSGVFEVCSNNCVRRSLTVARKTSSKKKSILMQLYIYPFYLVLRSFR